MSVEREARFLSGADIGRKIESFVGKAPGGLSYRREGILTKLLHEDESVEIYLDGCEEDYLWVPSSFLITVTGEPSDRNLVAGS